MEKKAIIPQGTDASAMIFSPGVQAGNLLYASGSIGSKEGRLVGNDIESQARQALENLGTVLQAAGSSWDKVVKVNCFLTYPQRDFQGWNKVFKTYFPANPPARTTVGGAVALEGGLIEIELVAIV